MSTGLKPPVMFPLFTFCSPLLPFAAIESLPSATVLEIPELALPCCPRQPAGTRLLRVISQDADVGLGEPLGCWRSPRTSLPLPKDTLLLSSLL